MTANTTPKWNDQLAQYRLHNGDYLARRGKMFAHLEPGTTT